MKSLFISLLIFFAFTVPVQAAETTFFGPIVPEQCQSCPCGFAGVLEIIRHLMNFAISFGIIVLTIMLAWGGLMYILSAANPESRSKANSMLTGAVIGMVLILSSWLIIDFVMRTLYSGPDGTEGKYGPWNSILAEDANWCIEPKPGEPLFDLFPFSKPPTTVPTQPSPNPNQPTTMPPDPTADGKFTYQSGIDAQAAHTSPALRSLLSCMAARVPANAGEISSISDRRIVNGDRTFGQCLQGGCAHSAGSCHYGGSKCTGSSYAVDFGDERNGDVLMKAARACGANFVDHEGDHIHVSIGASCGCN